METLVPQLPSKPIQVYSSTIEPYSEMLKSLLKYYSVPFENIDVTNKPERLMELIRLSGQASTPVMVIGEDVYIGFDREMMKRVLGLPDGKTEDISRDSQQNKEDQEV